jgi:hypothetical protein
MIGKFWFIIKHSARSLNGIVPRRGVNRRKAFLQPDLLADPTPINSVSPDTHGNDRRHT